jgi:nickel-dependent lactate racemase
MSAAAQIVKKGGVIITAAECWDGIPSGSDYEKILTSVESIDELTEYIKEHEKSLQDTWQVYFQVIIQQKASVYLYTDKLDNSIVSSTLFHPVSDPELLIRELVRESGPGTRICILPEGPQTIPYIRKSP